MSDPAADQTPIDIDDIEIVPDDGSPELADEAFAIPTDETMAAEPDDDSEDEDDDALLEDDEEDDDESEPDVALEDEELLELRRKNAEYQELQRRLEYQTQQQKNQEYWAGIEGEAEAAFEAKYAKIQQDKQGYIDPEVYELQKLGELNAEIKHWYKSFYASQNQAKAKAQERAAIPVYAARVATHYGLTTAQAHELLEYTPQQMDREAQKLARHNAQLSKYRKQLKQQQRGDARQGLARNPVGTGNSGRSAPVKVRAGSQNHLLALFAAAQRG